MGHWWFVRPALLLGCVAILIASCSQVQRLEPVPSGAELTGPRIRGHFLELNAASLEGRKTSSTGFGAASEYVSNQLRSYGLQPVHLSEFRHVAFGSLNHTSGAAIRVFRADTTTWSSDLEMIPDPRTSSARVSASSYRFVSEFNAIPPSVAGQVAVVNSDWSAAAITSLRRAGYAMALIAQAPQPGRSNRSLGLGLIQVSRSRLSEIFALSEGQVTTLLEEGGVGQTEIELETIAAYDAAAPLINTLAYLPGASPFRSDRLVIVAANLDSGGYPAGVALVDSSRSGMAAAALLEVARVLAYDADQGAGLDKTILFAWFAGGAQELSGLRAFLANPVWPLDQIDDLLFVGLDTADYQVPFAVMRGIGSDSLSRGISGSALSEWGLALAAAVRDSTVVAVARR